MNRCRASCIYIRLPVYNHGEYLNSLWESIPVDDRTLCFSKKYPFVGQFLRQDSMIEISLKVLSNGDLSFRHPTSKHCIFAWRWCKLVGNSDGNSTKNSVSPPCTESWTLKSGSCQIKYAAARTFLGIHSGVLFMMMMSVGIRICSDLRQGSPARCRSRKTRRRCKRHRRTRWMSGRMGVWQLPAVHRKEPAPDRKPNSTG